MNQRTLFDDSEDHKSLTAREAREMERQRRCPRCNSPKPELHPAMQFEGEVQICTHAFHASPPPPYSEPTTSRAAAEALVGNESERARVLGFVRDRGVMGATREEIGWGLNLAGDTLRPRVWELIRMGLMRESGETRKTIKGRDAKVIVATNAS